MSVKEYRAKLGSDGRLLIPVACRRELGLSANEEVIIQVENHQARLLSLNAAVTFAQDLVKKHYKGKRQLSDELIAERREEAKREEK